MNDLLGEIEEGKPTASFENFWSKTPKTGSKHQAWKKFSSFSEGQRQQAIDAVEGYYAWWSKANPSASTLHVSTYLNQRRWMDDDWKSVEEVKEPTQRDLMQAAIDNIKSGKPYMCTSISYSQCRYLVEKGHVTEEDCRKVGKW